MYFAFAPLRYHIYFLLAAGLFISQAGAQPPSARQLFQNMKQSIDTVKLIHYRLDYRNINGGQQDSLFWASSRTWAERVPADTIFGAHVHVRYEGKNGEADYYYDGASALDIYHRSPHPGIEKTVTVIQPQLLANGHNTVQARTTARGYCEELLSPVLNHRWAAYLDSMQVRDEGEHWLVQWTHTIPAENFIGHLEVALHKKDFLIRRISQRTRWHGVSMNQFTTIHDLQVNRLEDADSVRLRQPYEGYTVKYENRGTGKATRPPASLAGTKAPALRYNSFGGEPLSLIPTKGRYILLDFWETWCGYCFLAMPRLKALWKEFNPRGLQVVGVVTENRAQVEKMVKQGRFPYPTVFADEKAKKAYRLEGRPRYVLIDDTGTILGDIEGNLDAMEKQIRALIK